MMDFPPATPDWRVNADRTRLKQVMVNLLSNAIKYNRAGGTVTVSCSRTDGPRLRISVQDTGEGLSSEKLAHLFQPFNRLGKEDSAEEGSGIGLAVSKRLVELQAASSGSRSACVTPLHKVQHEQRTRQKFSDRVRGWVSRRTRCVYSAAAKPAGRHGRGDRHREPHHTDAHPTP
jgi:phosphoglycerate-specific signal transduction histidine kinase